MIISEWVFWFSFFVIFYTLLGYPLIVYLIFRIDWLRYLIRIPEDAGKVFLNPNIAGPIVLNQRLKVKEFTPSVSMLVAAYNEEKFIEKKILNCLQLDYPVEKIEFIFVTDGSTDKTPQIIEKYSTENSHIKLLHQPTREGKLKAIQRALNFAKGEIIVFSDANSMYNRDAIKHLVKHFQFEKVGCVAGEKRVISQEGKTEAESIYWKYESFLKKLDSEIYSIVGAAGEIFAIRKNLIDKIPDNVINEDFVLTMNVASKGYRVVYEPNAYSIETPTKSIFEEFKRRVRISTGGIQSISILKNLFNIKEYKFLSFQFISHRILRWTLMPISFLLLFISNVILFTHSSSYFYEVTFYLQFFIYSIALIGLAFELIGIRIQIIYLIFSFLLMNFASVFALITYPFRPKTNIWKKPER
ncbi:MAG: glycosyltransferase family 2 protein [Ignavibacteria bacterium]|nr:glycosyltransferase family 2 protein [Ignavibacteria bacterium]